ncbi:MAG: nodulation protein NfeD [Bacteroidales bacterium]|nr:nodulation protein NfeD [Bacteroidales bacterium]
MKNQKLLICVLLLLLAKFGFANYSADTITLPDSSKTLVYVFDMKQMIGPAIWRQTQQSFSEANDWGADYMIIQMNTYGGTLDAADSIRTKILNSKIPVYVFIDNNAASAGALISIACERIYMKKGSNIGAATVVNQTGEQMPDKYQAYMRSMMRSTAEAHGKDTIIQGNDTIFKWKRDPLIAEAMVDPREYIEGIIDTGKVLSFTTDEAIKYGFCEGKVDDLKEVLEKAEIKDYEIKEYKVSSLESVIGFLVNPVFSGILIMIIIGGIYFELQTPGIGFPIAASIIAAILYFAPLYLEGLAENWEIVIFVLGIILVGIEIFAFPGFGVAGISGIILIVTGLTMSMIDNIVFEFETNYFEIIFRSLFVVVLSMFISIILSLYLSKVLLTASASPLRFVVLRATQKTENGFIGIEQKIQTLVGKKGIASTILRPSGKIEIDDEIYDAKSEIGYIEKGEKIKVVRHEASQLYVIKNNG